ncbi:MAG: PQQ-dependent sugar dehydrogenase [Gemmataceae bacterium]|nr:PQQ-dependent sugar dehydrogenase [Gemmata sp.]MDW8198041.1 PQQ-dependent sugar dehydrogenase [Gemmataceae bacterium]
MMLSFRQSALVVGCLGLVGVAVLVVPVGGQGGQQNPPRQPQRPPWTTSKIVGSPDPPPKYKSVRVFPKARFQRPDLIARCPGMDRLFIGEQAGAIYSLDLTNPQAQPDLFLDLRKDYAALVPNPKAQGMGELYGLVFHPDFAKNRVCFVCYTLEKKAGLKGDLVDGTRVSRFRVTDTNPPRADPKSEQIIITFVGGGHNGGDLHFGPDGMLYISTGDARGPNPPDPLNTGQDCSDLLSSILRIDVNRQENGKNYAIPRDNPFRDRKDVRPEIWAFGFRNPWRMSFDRHTGDLWVGDVGWELWEMVHKVEKGGNYGWSIVEGRQPIKPDQKIGPTPIRPPMIEIPHTLGASVTGGYVYRGQKFPELVGAYIFGDWETRRIWAARFENHRLQEMPEIVKPTVRVSAFGEDNAGELYYVDYDSGFLYTLGRNEGGTANTRFPTTLSATGLFDDVHKLKPAAGVIPFVINSRQWQDGAEADYHLALPGHSSVRFFDTPRPLPGQVYWHSFRSQFPAGAVLVKTLTLPVVDAQGQPHRRRIETQILHYDGEDWRGYSYAWRDDQADADLVPADGAEKTFRVAIHHNVLSDKALELVHREVVWTFHSRAQCMSCHHAWSEYALAFNLPQLNRPLTTAANAPQQLVQLAATGYVKRIAADDRELPPFDETMAQKQPALAALTSTAPLDVRVRSYLHTNCAHCHRFGGGGGQVVLELDFAKPLQDTGIFDVKPRQGDFGLPNARILAPGDPYRSVLFYRMAKFGRGRMPHLGSEIPDIAALDCVAEWIAGLGTPPQKWLPPPAAGMKVNDALVSFSAAWPLARAFGIGRANKSQLQELAAAFAQAPANPLHELFDGYWPADPQGRKLGSNPRPATILALTGNISRGETLFFNPELKCVNCHKIGDRGTSLGPDLSRIGAERSRTELLDSLLNPSARVDPQYAAFNIRTKDDQTYTGIITRRNDVELVLRDANNREITLDADAVESVRPSRLSLMPDGLLSGLTPQHAADLLDYLASRK